MSRKQQTSVWLLVLLVAVLFMLSVLAPREWQAVAVSPVELDELPRTLALQARPQSTPRGGHSEARPGDDPAVESSRPGDSLAAEPAVAEPPKTLAEPLIEIWRPAGLGPPETVGLSAADQPAAVTEPSQGKSLAATETDVPEVSFPGPPSDRRIIEIRPRVTRQHVASAGPGQSSPRFASPDHPEGALPAEASGPAISLIPAIRIRPVDAQLISQAQPSTNAVTPHPLVDRQSSVFSGSVITSWPYPATLVTRLEGLGEFAEARSWCLDVRSCLDQLHSQQELASPPVSDALARLRNLQETAFQRAEASESWALAAEWTRVGYALARRLSVWERIHTIGMQSEASNDAAARDDERFCELLEVVQQRLGGSRRGADWKQYLLIDAGQQTFCDRATRNSDRGRALAKQILLRMDHALLTPDQRTFLAQPEFVQLAVELQQLAAEPVDYFRLLDVMERFEEQGNRQQALHLAAAQMILGWSRTEAVAALGHQLDTNYRNANLRVSVSTDLVNRLLPGQVSETEPVRDVILGTPTVGCSETVSKVRVRCLPSPETWRLELAASGEVFSETRSHRGPATLFSRGNAVFRAEKEVTVDRHGLRQSAADAVADSDARLTGVSTNLDRVPVIGDLLQAIATQRYESQRRAARQEVRSRVARRARTRFDEEVNQQLEELAAAFVDRFYQPMESLALNPLAQEMRTTHRRMIARYRLAGDHQLAAHTPRPIAPAECLVSMQIHQSAMNNIIEQLDWEGRSIELRELYGELAERFRLGDGQAPEDFPEDVMIRFAEEDPVRFRLEDGRMAITISLDELKQGRRNWRDFTVRVFYEPALDDPHADLVREQYVELIGRRLNFRDQIALRGIFSRVFAKNQPVDFISRRLQSDSRLEGLAVIQTVIQDGWIGIAVGPRDDELIAERSSLPAMGTLR